MKQPELKPCPRCGGRAEIRDTAVRFGPQLNVCCIACGLTTDVLLTSPDNTAAWWNKRPAEPEHSNTVAPTVKCIEGMAGDLHKLSSNHDAYGGHYNLLKRLDDLELQLKALKTKPETAHSAEAAPRNELEAMVNERQPEPAEQVCPDCNGSGLEDANWTCPTCGATGKVKAASAEAESLRRRLEVCLKRTDQLAASRLSYVTRMDLLQKQQERMREPERTIVCDILANGALLPDPDGKRYGKPAEAVEHKCPYGGTHPRRTIWTCLGAMPESEIYMPCGKNGWLCDRCKADAGSANFAMLSDMLRCAVQDIMLVLANRR